MNSRKFPRINYKCRIKVQKNGKEERMETFTENIGQGGICVSLPADIGIFEEVTLEMFLGEEKGIIQCLGKVVWVVKGHPANREDTVMYDTGIEFVDLVKQDKEKVEALIEDLLTGKT
ncbi:MAG: PilZ domain-containing protein [Candidatus Omnitrophota bacterium]